MRKTSIFELYDMMREVLEDIDLGPKHPDWYTFEEDILTVSMDKVYTEGTKAFRELKVHLTPKGFGTFIEHVSARAQHIGEEFVTPTRLPVKGLPKWTRVSWQGIPGIEFFTLEEDDN